MPTPTPVTRDDLLAYLDKSASPSENVELDRTLEAATEAAEGWQAVGPIVVREFTDRVHTDNGWLKLPHTPVQSVTSATNVADGTVYLTADLDVDGITGIVRLADGSRITRGDYIVVYNAGRDPVPAALEQAVLIIAGHLWETQQGPTTNRFIGSEGESGVSVGMGYLIPNRAAHLLQPHAAVLVS